MKSASIAAVLADALPGADVRADSLVDGYAIAGMRPRAAVRPVNVEQVAAVLDLAVKSGWAVAPIGGGTMRDLGNPPRRYDIAVDLSRLDAVLDYQPDDLTITVQAGATLTAIASALNEHGQMLPWDVPLPDRATVGGALACNVAGPRRLRYGAGRDLVIGMQAAVPGLGLTRSGGKVVKNVAGYDLAKLHIGALGTAGIITEVTFKLSPAPPAEAAVVAAFPTLEEGAAAAAAILDGQLFPAAVELIGPSQAVGRGGTETVDLPTRHCTLAVLLVGLSEAVERQTVDLLALCQRLRSAAVAKLEAEGSRTLFAEVRDYGRDAAMSAALILRASVLPARVALAISALGEATEALAAAPVLNARPGVGLVFGYWTKCPTDAVAPAVARVRAKLAAAGGHLVIERAPTGTGIDAWGLAGADVTLMRRLKQAYDPTDSLNPGRFVAEI